MLHVHPVVQQLPLCQKERNGTPSWPFRGSRRINLHSLWAIWIKPCQSVEVLAPTPTAIAGPQTATTNGGALSVQEIAADQERTQSTNQALLDTAEGLSLNNELFIRLLCELDAKDA